MQGQQLIILMVEDDPAHAEIIRRNFEEFRAAIRLVHVSDGRQALDYLQPEASRDDANRPRPDLILLDLRLPRVNGLEVLRIRKGDPALRDIPVVVMTTSASEKEIARAYDLGANSYLVKPVGFKEFCAMMTSIGHYWLVWNRYPC